MPRYSEIVQSLYQEITELRRNPPAYVPKLEHFQASYHGLVRHRADDVPILTKEGADLVQEAITRLAATPPLRTATWSDALSCAAQAHVNDLGPRGIIGHHGSNGDNLVKRLEAFGKWDGTLAEVLDYGSLNPVEAVCSLLVDDGLPIREHRDMLLSPEIRLLGIGFGPHDQQRTMATILLVSKFQPHEDYPRYLPSGDLMATNWEARNWLVGALRLSCDVTSESEGTLMRRRITKRWEMGDGSSQTTEEVIYS